jgi:hypothetical protein
MKKFIFNDITIFEAWQQFNNDIGDQYELNNGNIVLIDRVTPIVKESFPCLNYKKNNLPDFNLSNGELNLDKFIGSGEEMYGFNVTIRTLPYRIKENKCVVENPGLKESLIHNK